MDGLTEELGKLTARHNGYVNKEAKRRATNEDLQEKRHRELIALIEKIEAKVDTKAEELASQIKGVETKILRLLGIWREVEDSQKKGNSNSCQ